MSSYTYIARATIRRAETPAEDAVQKKLTITIDAEVYDGLYRVVGPRKISKFIEDLVRPEVVSMDLAAGYAAMAADEEREREAMEWCKAPKFEAEFDDAEWLRGLQESFGMDRLLAALATLEVRND